MARATLILGRDGMGPEADEGDFTSWVAFVVDHVDDVCGFAIAVEERAPGDIQADSILAYDEDDRLAVRAAKVLLWDEWCAYTGEEESAQ